MLTVLPSFLIGLREGLEAALVVGILIAYARRSGNARVLPWLWGGVALAVAVSLGVGAILTWGPYGLSFQAQEILGGSLSIVAVGLVTWMILWMSKSARSMKRELEGRLDAAITGSAVGIVVLAALSVGREGIETALFVWANVASTGTGWWGAVAAGAGILVAAFLGWLVQRGAVRLKLSTFFTVTGYALVVVAAGVLAYGIGDLQEAGVLPGYGVWAFDVSAAIPPTSWYGVLLQGVFNFTPQPTWLQVIGWAVYLVAVTVLFAVSSRRPIRASAPAAGDRGQTTDGVTA